MADMVIDMKAHGRNEPFWVSYIKQRVDKKKNFLGIITGPTGSGKSWAGLSICKQLDPEFDKSRIIFSLKELMVLINSGKLKSGSCILWDESGIDASNRSWQSLTNKAINFLMQTFRHKRFILIFTVPYMDFVDAGTRKLFHAEFTTLNIDFKEKKCKVKPELIQYNSRNKKFYYKFLRVRTVRGVAPLRCWRVSKPSDELINQYEELKNAFTTKLNNEIEQQINKEELAKDNKKQLTDLQLEVMQGMAKYNSASKVAEIMNTSKRLVYFHLGQAKKKGYTVEEFKENVEQ